MKKIFIFLAAIAAVNNLTISANAFRTFLFGQQPEIKKAVETLTRAFKSNPVPSQKEIGLGGMVLTSLPILLGSFLDIKFDTSIALIAPATPCFIGCTAYAVDNWIKKCGTAMHVSCVLEDRVPRDRLASQHIQHYIKYNEAKTYPLTPEAKQLIDAITIEANDTTEALYQVKACTDIASQHFNFSTKKVAV